jgi:hypothetical protein
MSESGVEENEFGSININIAKINITISDIAQKVKLKTLLVRMQKTS